jgi:hypothetical protein
MSSKVKSNIFITLIMVFAVELLHASIVIPTAAAQDQCTRDCKGCNGVDACNKCINNCRGGKGTGTNTDNNLSLALDQTVIDLGVVDLNAIMSNSMPEIPPLIAFFDLNVSFDPSVLTPISVTFSPFLGNLSSDSEFSEAVAEFDFPKPGVVHLSEQSLLSPSDLAILQHSSFSLANISFGFDNGISEFNFRGDIRVEDAFGNNLLVTVPELSAWAMLLLGFGGLGFAAAAYRYFGPARGSFFG